MLKVDHLCAGKMVKDVSFLLRKGEILGMAGLMGAGRTETARALFGADPKESGDIYVDGQKVVIHSPQDAVKAGIGYLSEDRKRFGLVLDKSVSDNTCLATLEKFRKGVFLNKGKADQVAKDYVKKLKTKTPNVETTVGSCQVVISKK